MGSSSESGPEIEQENRPKIIRHWKRIRSLRYFGLIVLLVFVAAFGGLYHYSTSPQFCRSCHIMVPYYEAWKTSTHNKIACVKCHYPPEILDTMWVKFQALSQLTSYITRTYGSKPRAEVEDASCLQSGCHAHQLLQGDLLFKGFVKFNHREHLNKRRAGKQLRCTSCHSQVVVGNHMVVTEQTCFQCHFNRGVRDARHLEPLGGCNNCHTSPSRNIKIGNIIYNHVDFVGKKDVPCQDCHIDTIQGDGEAPKERCLNCHNKPDHLARYNDTAWLHDQHVSGKNIACPQCHKPIEHRIPKRDFVHTTRLQCAACHQSEHDNQQKILMGTGGIGVSDLPSPMQLARVQCVACHYRATDINGGATLFYADERACVKCHPQSYRGMVSEWKITIQKALAEINPKLEQAKNALKKSTDAVKRLPAQELYNDALHNVKMVKEGNPVHNIYYTARLLQEANNRINKMGDVLSFTPIHLGRNSLISGNFCNTLCHNRVGVELPERVTWNNIRIPHQKHAISMKLGCTTCHVFKQHKQVHVKIKREECLNCHHQPLKKVPNLPCQACHRRQVAFRKGQSLGESTITKAPMTSLPCRSCHMKINERHKEADLRASCKQCHGNPAYVNILDAWKKSVADKREAVQATMAKFDVLMEDAPSDARKKVFAKLDETRKILETIAMDQSGGVHNVPYATKLLQQAEKILGEAGDILSPQTAANISATALLPAAAR